LAGSPQPQHGRLQNPNSIVTPVGTTIVCMTEGIMCIDNASDTTFTALSRIFCLIKAINLRGIK
jgi:hypothetical protein